MDSFATNDTVDQLLTKTNEPAPSAYEHNAQRTTDRAKAPMPVEATPSRISITTERTSNPQMAPATGSSPSSAARRVNKESLAVQPSMEQQPLFEPPFQVAPSPRIQDILQRAMAAITGSQTPTPTASPFVSPIKQPSGQSSTPITPKTKEIIELKKELTATKETNQRLRQTVDAIKAEKDAIRKERDNLRKAHGEVVAINRPFILRMAQELGDMRASVRRAHEYALSKKDAMKAMEELQDPEVHSPSKEPTRKPHKKPSATVSKPPSTKTPSSSRKRKTSTEPPTTDKPSTSKRVPAEFFSKTYHDGKGHSFRYCCYYFDKEGSDFEYCRKSIDRPMRRDTLRTHLERHHKAEDSEYLMAKVEHMLKKSKPVEPAITIT